MWFPITYLKTFVTRSPPTAVMAERVELDTSSTGVWTRMVLRMKLRAQWSYKGVLLWMIQRPELRWVPFPLPQVVDVESWKKQCAQMVMRRSWPKSWSRKAMQNQKFTLQNLKDAAHLRGRLGMRMSFLEDNLIMEAHMTLKQKPKKMIEKALLAERRKLINMTETARQKRVEELVGPRGGLPRVKGELQELCVLLSIEVANDDTVEKLKEKLRPMMDTLKGNKMVAPALPEKAEKAKAKATKAAAAAPKALPAGATSSQGPKTEGQFFQPAVIPPQILALREALAARREDFPRQDLPDLPAALQAEMNYFDVNADQMLSILTSETAALDEKMELESLMMEMDGHQMEALEQIPPEEPEYFNLDDENL